MFQSTMAGGMNLGFPDVCLTPTAVGPIPVPYPNTTTGALMNPATTALTVLCDGMPALNQSSMSMTSMGDNAGVNTGVASGVVMGPMKFVLGSFTVFKGGSPAQKMTSMTGHNGLSMNCPGTALSPSQVIVMVIS